MLTDKKDLERRERQSDWLRLRWEFTRDNQDYREAYEAVRQLRKDSACPPDSVESEGQLFDHRYFLTPEGKQEKEYCEKFSLYSECMINPNKSYDKLMEGPDCMEKVLFWPATFWGHFADFTVDGSKLTVTIDLSKVNSFETLKSEIVNLLDLILNNLYRNLKKYFGPGGRGKRLSKHYNIILDVGRLHKQMQAEKVKKGKKRVTYPEVARKYSPKSYATDPEGTRKRIANYVKEYRRLVDGGYREITYP